MIFHVARTALIALKRDRGALVLSFVLPIVFFSIFAVIFGKQNGSTPKVKLIVVDEDQSETSRDLVKGLMSESSLVVRTSPAAEKKNAPSPAAYTAATAEAAVKAGDAPVALVIPQGFGQHPIAFGPGGGGSSIELLNDQSDTIAPQIVMGLLQKAAMTAMPASMADEGMKYADEYMGGFTPAQRAKVDEELNALKKEQASGKIGTGNGGNDAGAGIVAVKTRAVVGEDKKSPMISFYAAAIGVMFLLFTASGSAGALLDEAESGTLERVLSTRVTMTRLLAGKLVFNTLLAFVQLVAMFLWGWAVFKLDFLSHVPGFVVMGLCTAFAVAAFGILLASACHTRAQLGALSTLLILIMSSVGGSMFPRFLMPESMQKAGLLTINAWAIDGFTKVFWRDLPVSDLWPQVAVLLAIGVVLFVVARRVARRWEVA
ncbi:ABC multidrug efflux pump, inner membrane subunit [Candidatus Sulfotelmatomonas gaucii]|uniref:ABC multidrug efflux pump, inner membrane subunit n=1 Tax=Candidatus Sulfuritelmatomonas gaucii TaxID=2043161 RepID=A0A2N9LAD5_9BACT|nr:ABC multidrug efflux pump, inner membrane subunit [Candidatus Sulfotelmatomonas gaucii]